MICFHINNSNHYLHIHKSHILQRELFGIFVIFFFFLFTMNLNWSFIMKMLCIYFALLVAIGNAQVLSDYSTVDDDNTIDYDGDLEVFADFDFSNDSISTNETSPFNSGKYYCFHF